MKKNTFFITLILLPLALNFSVANAQATNLVNPSCSSSNTPTAADVMAKIQALFNKKKLSSGFNVTLNFAPITNSGNGGGGAGGFTSAQTVCGSASPSSGISCQITIDPRYVNSVITPINFDHEFTHVWCYETNCGVNFNAVNSGNINTGYNNTPSAPFGVQEILTHYQDYNAYLGALKSAINNHDQAMACYIANLGTQSMLYYNQMMMYTQQTLDTVGSALTNAANDSQLNSTGTSADKSLSITFPSYDYATGIQAVQVTLISPGTGNKELMLQFPLANTSIAGSATSAPNYAAAISALMSSISNSNNFLATLPTQIQSPSAIYDMLVSAGYAPANSFNPKLTRDFYSYPASGSGACAMQTGYITSQAPVCSAPCSMTFIFPDGATRYYPLECYNGNNGGETGSNGACTIGQEMVTKGCGAGAIPTLPVLYGTGNSMPGSPGFIGIAYSDLQAALQNQGTYSFKFIPIAVTGLESHAVEVSSTAPIGYTCGTTATSSAPWLGGSGQITFTSRGPAAVDFHGSIVAQFSCMYFDGTSMNQNVPGAQIILKF